MKYRSGIMTDFSIGQSLLTIDKLITSAKETGLEKIIVADDMTISSLISLQKKAKSEGIKAMVGVKFRCYADPTIKQRGDSNPFFMVNIYPKNENGLRSIFHILTIANSQERFYYNPRGCVNDLKLLQDCVLTSGDLNGLVDDTQLESVLSVLDKTCSYYSEIVPIDSPLWIRINKTRLSHLSHKGVKGGLIGYPARYESDDEADSLPVLRAVCTNTHIDINSMPKQFVTDYSIKTTKTPLALFDSLVSRLGLSEFEIDDLTPIIDADAFNYEPFYEFEHHAPCLPKMADDEFGTLVAKCMTGWKKRLFEERLGYKPSPEMLSIYKKRLAYELSILKKMGFAGYFLVVEDLVNWSKNNGVRVGCGRGSGGGSLVAYLMGITEVDPIRFNLIFERFINPSRLDLPDIDLDYQSSKRNKVIEYLISRYGADRVAGISNYGTLASASAFRDTGRVFGLSPLDMSATKLVPKENGISFSLTESANLVPEIDKLKNDYPEIWKHALRFEGVMRSLGQHAAGTVVAGEPLVNRAVVERRAEGNVVNWDKRVVEDYGLIKMDILGLSTLDVLDIAQEYIKARHGVDVDYLKLPLNDTRVLEAFGRGDTTAVFQFDSQGMQTLLKRLARNEPLTFEDITAATALYRPGPLDSGLTEEYIAIKQGMKAPHYEHPIMKNALGETYGVMVYQEEVMQVARDVAGFTMAEADSLRKAMGKKDLEKMAHMKDKFVNGAVSVSGLDARVAEALFEKIEKFAGYGFNKSHAVAYSILSYWTCWLKVYYPAEYFAAQLSIVKEDKYANLVKDARSCGIKVTPPDVNFSSARFEIKDDQTIVMPFSAVKGCSEKIANNIVSARKMHGGFKSMQDFVDVASMKGSGINKRVVENLNLVGAFADIEPTQPSVTDESRLKDQVTLMPGLIIETVVSKSTTAMDEAKKLEIINVFSEVQKCKKCDLCKSVHCVPTVGGAKCRFMMVFDCPSQPEADKGKVFVGSGAKIVKELMKECGVSATAGYYTTLVKAKKNGKFLTNDQLNGCAEFIDKEVELVKPGVIVCMGSSSAKHFLPDVKSPSSEVGNAYFNKNLDATVIIGMNPLQLVFNPSKAETLAKVIRKLAETLGVA